MTHLFKRIVQYIRSLPILPHGRCEFCGPKGRTDVSRCRQLLRIAGRVEGIRHVPIETIQKWSEPRTRLQHKKIIKWEDEFTPLHVQQPSPASQELRDQLRLCEVRLRGELPEPTADQLRRYAVKLERQNKSKYQ